jgi:hypothetical protein
VTPIFSGVGCFATVKRNRSDTNFPVVGLPGIKGLPELSFTAHNKGNGVVLYTTYPLEELIEVLLFVPEIAKSIAALPILQGLLSDGIAVLTALV